jgi:hypothetical protein
LADGSLAGSSGACLMRDYWLMQARLWLADAVCGPEPETPADGLRMRD